MKSSLPSPHAVALVPLLCAVIGAGCVPELPMVDEPCEAWAQPGIFQFDIEVDGKTRHSFVQVPGSEGPRDLYVVLHGGGMSQREMGDVTRFIGQGKRTGAVTVFPRGTGVVKSWNGFGRRSADDVAFLDQLVRELSPSVCGANVLGVGFSAGGHMVHRWACEGEEVDAFSAMAGLAMAPTCEGKPIPLRQYQGVTDRIVKIDGGGGVGRNGDFISLDQSMAIWLDRNGCTEEPSTVFLEQGPTQCEAWSCEVPTELCVIDDFGHAWPGGATAPAGGHDATVEIVDWFQSLDLDAGR